MKFFVLLLLLVGCYDGKIPYEEKSDILVIKEIDSTSEEWVPYICKCGIKQPDGIIIDESEPRNQKELDELLLEIEQRDKEKAKKLKKAKRLQ